MKKYKILLVLFILIFGACQEKLEENYVNPESVDANLIPEQVMSSMFARMVYQWQYFIKDYGELWWQNSGNGVSQYAQINHRYITSRYSWYSDYNDVVSGNGFDDSQLRNYFNNFYTKMRDWVLMKDLLETFTEDQKTDNQIYVDLAIAIKNWGAIRNVDFFNKIPYSEAFKGNEGIFFPKYDDPMEIYKSVLTEWGEIVDRLPGVYAGMSETGKNILAKQDYALKGDVDKWIQWINGMRLRFAVRMSGVDQEFARTVIADAISNVPTEDLYFFFDYNEKANLPQGGYTWQRGFYERNYVLWVTNTIMKRMNFGELTYEEGTDDPRLPVIAMPTKWGDYRGVSMDADANGPIYNGGDRYYPYADNLGASLEQNAVSNYNHKTYAHNVNCPAIMMTVGEMDLLKAEAVLKGFASTGKTAAQHIKDAVASSTDFWYFINAQSNYGQPTYPELNPVKPTDNIISSYGDIVAGKLNAAANVEDKMEIIMQQKYIHHNVFEPYELFAELRRTRHPKLEPFTFNGVVMKPTPERIKYPSSELQTNTENYNLVKNEDNFTSHIFWVPENKRNESYYRDNYDY